jgi:O-antigen ligase
MPPALAALLTAGFIAALFLREGKRARGPLSPALWLPVLWLAVISSRFISQWIDTFSGGFTFSSVEDGNPLDAAYFSALILVGGAVLAQRRAVVDALVRNNRLLLLFLLFGLVSVAWSDFPAIAIKRWIKACGHPIMALVILTDPDPVRAFRVVMKRCSFLLLPVSVLFIKYFPQYGRGFDYFTGAGFNRGVGITKNDLGYISLVFSLFYLWNWFAAAEEATKRLRLEERVLSVVFLAMAAWLLKNAQSATSLLTFFLGAGVILVLRSGLIRRRRIVAYLLLAGLAGAVGESTFGLYEMVVRSLGRAPTLTDRTVVWADVIAMQDRPLIGAGFESFWLGTRLEILWAKWWWRPNQAHNGYIETYLNLGWIGVILLVAVLIGSLWTILRRIAAGKSAFDDLRLALLLVIIVFNFTEATFKGVHMLWTMFYLVALDLGVAARRVPRKAVANDGVAIQPGGFDRPLSPGGVAKR